MNFEEKLLECGSLGLIDAYVTEHCGIVSEEFKLALTGKIKSILQAINCEDVSSGDLVLAHKQVLDMNVELFIKKFYGEIHRCYNGYEPHLPKDFFTQCRENNIHTAGDLLKFGQKNVIKMRHVGPVIIRKIEEAFCNAGIPEF